MKDFRSRLVGRDLLAGTFIKSPAHQGVEIAGLSGLDFVIVDAEHAPITYETVDRCVMAGRAAGVAVLVRVPEADSTMIQQALDLGAAGVVVPHVSSQAVAQAVVGRSRLRGGQRGYSNSVRAADFGRIGMDAFVQRSDAEVVVIVQIEDPSGVADVEAIAAVQGVDALFIGRADLALALGVSSLDDPAVMTAAEAITHAAAQAGKACGTFAADASRIDEQLAMGMSFFVIGSDQSAMRASWDRIAGEVAASRPAPRPFVATAS